MNVNRLRDILNEVTLSVRKAEAVEELHNQTDDMLLKIHKAYGYLPSYDMLIKANPPLKDLDTDLIDCHYFNILVDRDKASIVEDELKELLAEYPFLDRLASGLNYKETGDHLGDFQLALPLFALGHSLHFWNITLPTGETPLIRDINASAGYISISGWTPEDKLEE